MDPNPKTGDMSIITISVHCCSSLNQFQSFYFRIFLLSLMILSDIRLQLTESERCID